MNQPDWSNPNLTYGDILRPAMSITDQKEADEYKDAYIRYIVSGGTDVNEAERIVNSNIGYFSGYYDTETMQRVQQLFHCTHPIFGSTVPTAKEAFNAGYELGKKNGTK